MSTSVSRREQVQSKSTQSSIVMRYAFPTRPIVLVDKRGGPAASTNACDCCQVSVRRNDSFRYPIEETKQPQINALQAT